MSLPTAMDFVVASSPGVGAFGVTVGPVDVVVRGVTEATVAEARRRYGAFFTAAEGGHTVRVARGAPGYLPIAPDRNIVMEETTVGGNPVLVSNYFAARRDGERSGTLLVSRIEDEDAVQRALENYLRWIVGDEVVERGGFVLHASGVVRDGRAYLFFGPSGAGKSTVAELSPGCRILSDDLVLVTDQGASFHAATTPFHGTHPHPLDDRGTYPLAALLRLVQSDTVALERLPVAVASGMVLASCPFVPDGDRRARHLLPLLERLCTTTPVYRLRFRREPTFWQAIDAALRP